MNRVAELGGGQQKIDDQHKKGKMTARERIGLLLDQGTFNELDKFVTHRSADLGLDRSHPLGDGVVTGYGKVDGRLVYVYAHDFTVFGGSLGEALMKKISKVMDLALKNGAPIIGLNDSGGARIQEGVSSLAGVSEMFFRNTLASGVIPQISAVLGPSAGAAVYSPAMTDFIFMVKGTGQMFVTGPDVVKAALGETVTFEDLGGAMVHATQSGVAHFMYDSENACLKSIRALLSYLPQNNTEPPPAVEWKGPAEADSGMDDLAPVEPYRAYDVRKIVERLVDGASFMEVHAGWAQNIVVGFGRVAGNSVGVVANQPQVLGGALDVDSSDKAARFVRFCDAFNIPILTLVDVPGYLPGTDQEQRGLIRHGCKLLYAYCEATAPKVTLIVKKAYGGAYCAMGSKYSRADINYAWPGAEIAVMGPEGAVNIIHRKEIEASSDPDALRKQLTSEYRAKFANPYVAASRGIIDEVIAPSMTRPKLISAFESLASKSEFRPPKKHGNIQL
ncbi:MAG: acyl-CoA carboxylase subunit beta [Nitrososphaerota archaeon]|nr:acyl-CoA carboxylase subunit beta [Nitrososphaerota archaeon]MDG6956610.1 acyl-CoA carboxylase subunit beta [Nitrososphaerota archaeon]MDG6957619.1 acyl-CoA carboxylase subunit beta [Nitrososphaerota archaeon]MDG6965723.1 acyl-CoA carboxylase subunit beta [Nitrososphaerota archaeon]MDG6974058.1 acyl-CoA carboxylase subunit beta [Nitrososphaerota archaeon]